MGGVEVLEVSKYRKSRDIGRVEISGESRYRRCRSIGSVDWKFRSIGSVEVSEVSRYRKCRSIGRVDGSKMEIVRVVGVQAVGIIEKVQGICSLQQLGMVHDGAIEPIVLLRIMAYSNPSFLLWTFHRLCRVFIVRCSLFTLNRFPSPSMGFHHPQ
jgi:hypothetical protein